jgi:hypothetical protein
VYIAGGSGSTSIGARWGSYSGGVPTTGYNAELLTGRPVKPWHISLLESPERRAAPIDLRTGWL